MRRLLIPAIALCAASCETVPADPVSSSDIRYITTDAAREAGFPFSPAVEADGWVFLSGALGTVPGGGLAPGGIGPETRQTMDNIQATLESEGLGWDRVVKCSVFLADIAEWPAFNEIYKTYFDSNYPARSALGASGLALGARVEIECIAKR
ncbi:MAG: RidA family protein [Pseudomonadota bacterium]